MTGLEIIGIAFAGWVLWEYRDWRREIRHEQKTRKGLDRNRTGPTVNEQGHDAPNQNNEER